MEVEAGSTERIRFFRGEGDRDWPKARMVNSASCSPHTKRNWALRLEPLTVRLVNMAGSARIALSKKRSAILVINQIEATC